MNTDVLALLNSIKQSQWYEVEVDLPTDIRFTGVLPYSVWVHADGRARISVLAPDEDSATERVYEWLNSLDENT